MKRAVIIDAVRTPITKGFQGELRDTRPDDLAASCIDALLQRNSGLDRQWIDDCIVGCGFPEGAQGMNLGKNVAVASGLGEGVAGCTVSRYCASGLEAIANAAGRVASGYSEAVIAAGVESVSQTLRTVNTERLFNPRIEQKSPGTYLRMNPADRVTPFWKRAFRCMGETAEILAERERIGRAQQDEFACRSQARTAAAQRAELFADEIIAVLLEPGLDLASRTANQSLTIRRDLCNRPDTTEAVLAGLEPSFRPNGTVTAGNAAPPCDGAAAALIVSEGFEARYALPKLGYFSGYAVTACEPELMGKGPTLAIPKLLARHGLRLTDIDLFEINEAFAAQMVYCERALNLNPGRVNVNGGAISVGHPFGMTGVRLVGHLLRELRRRGGRRGVVAMCTGGGIGVAALVEAAQC